MISPQSHVRRVLPVWLYQTPQVFSASYCSNTGSIRNLRR
jgi:hypothetical protein